MRDKGGAGAENKLLRLRNTASFYCTYIYCEDFIYLRIIKGWGGRDFFLNPGRVVLWFITGWHGKSQSEEFFQACK